MRSASGAGKNYIRLYYRQIQSGKAVVGKWIKLLYEYLINGLKKRKFYYDAGKAERAVDFVENFCHHSEGREDLITLELWQKAALAAIFGIVDKKGIRIFREVFMVVARKNGKTLFCSAIIAYVNFCDGEYGSATYCLAPKLEQAYKVYDGFYQMLVKSPPLMKYCKKRRSDVYLEATNSSVKPIAFNAKKSDGFNPHLTICDEIASWPAMQGNKQYEVMKSALGARKQPLIISISTAGYIDDGPYDDLMKRSTAFLLGNSEEKRLLPFLYIIDDVDKWDDIEELKKSNPNLNVSVKEEYYQEEIAVAKNSLSKKAEFLTKYCNIKQNASVAWMRYEDINAVCGDSTKLEDFRDCYCVGGIDLSQTTDLTACSIVIERACVLHTFTRFFMPKNRIAALQEREGVPYDIYVQQGFITPSGENYVDYMDCYNWFVSLVNDYQIYPLQVGYDRYSAQYLVKDMEAFGFHMDDVFQGENLTPVIREAEGLILDKKLQLGTNNLLKAHFLNVAMKQNAETRKIRPIKIEERCHIDGFVSVIDALTVRQKWYDQIGEQLKNED
nr:MAG TPA: Large Terminase [Caudoviricetes sp.]